MGHHHDHGHNTKKIGWTILLNVIITVAEYIGGIYSGSLALLSDAGHNFSDVLSLILGWFGEKFSQKKPNKKHTFGLKRFEIFTALINSLSLWAIGVLIIYHAIERLTQPDENISIGLMMGIATIGLAGNAISILILNKEKDKNLNMKAAYQHLFYDTLSSVVVIISGIVIYFTGLVILDVIISIFIALMIFYSGFEIIKSSLHIFMQGVPEGIEFDKVHDSICNITGVQSAHEVHIWSINSNEIFLSAHVLIDPKIKPSNDKIIKEINNMLMHDYHIEHTSLQLEDEMLCGKDELCS
ncbi:MAG: cation diffusion facilitator family transporter [Candidatus Delongbacteria bacterium]|jgi:cobalt-zinc-cadmium efflux system protein|nr:cation diffusion facilitator family transporter [Candidatus Delongbacteria bacterium]